MQTATDWKARLKATFDENPLATLGVGALVVTSASKLLNAMTSAKNSRAWSKEVARRERMSYARPRRK